MHSSKLGLEPFINFFISVFFGCMFAVTTAFHIGSFFIKPNILLIILLAILFGITIGFVWQRWIYPKFIIITIRSRIIILIVSVLAGIWFMFAIPLFWEVHSKRAILPLFCSDVFTLSFLFFTIAVSLIAQPLNYARPVKISRWTWLFYGLPIIFVWTLFLLAYWPGSLSYDSINQWQQMTTFKFTDWHPVFHTLVNWLITRIWLSPAAIALSQVTAMGLVLGWGLAEQRRFGAPRWLPWLTIIVIVAIPSNGIFVITLWKDVFYSISIVALTILIYKIAGTQGMWIQQRYAVFILVLTSALVALFRHNGAPVAFLTLVCLVIFYHQLWKRFLIALVLTLTIWFGVRWPIYNALGVDRTSPMASQPGVGMALAHLIARYTNTDTQFSDQERTLLRQIRPGKKWPYECYLETDLFFTKLNWTNLREYTPDLALLSLKLIYRNPSIFVDHVICTSSFLYQIQRSPNSLYEPIETGIYTNNFGIKRESKFAALKNIIDNSPNQSNQAFNWLFWRVPFWSYLLLAGLVIFGARSKNWKILLVFLPIFLNMLPFTFMAVLQSFRYVYPTLIVSALMSGYFLVTKTYPQIDGFSNISPKTGQNPEHMVEGEVY